MLPPSGDLECDFGGDMKENGGITRVQVGCNEAGSEVAFGRVGNGGGKVKEFFPVLNFSLLINLQLMS
jgi:hypothetical protein